eukprot:3116329-Heterocapsa_arctica.AAC.1
MMLTDEKYVNFEHGVRQTLGTLLKALPAGARAATTSSCASPTSIDRRSSCASPPSVDRSSRSTAWRSSCASPPSVDR